MFNQILSSMYKFKITPAVTENKKILYSLRYKKVKNWLSFFSPYTPVRTVYGNIKYFDDLLDVALEANRIIRKK